MAWTLRIEFGGLCMFVERHTPPTPEDRGLFVLMPVMQHPEPHFAVLEYKPKGSNDDKLVDLSGTIVRLRDLGSHTTTQGPFDRRIARPSLYSGRKVNEQWLSGSVTDPLAARVEMPLGLEPQVIGPFGRLRVDPHHRNLTLGGRAHVSMRIADESITAVEIGPETIERDAGPQPLHVKIINATEHDLNCRKQRPHKKDDESHHFQAYYSLLDDGCQDPHDCGPKLIIDENVAGDDDPDCKQTGGRSPRDGRLAAEARDDVEPFEGHFVDPFMCTIGIGCPPESDTGC